VAVFTKDDLRPWSLGTFLFCPLCFVAARIALSVAPPSVELLAGQFTLLVLFAYPFACLALGAIFAAHGSGWRIRLLRLTVWLLASAILFVFAGYLLRQSAPVPEWVYHLE
jgi:uncharacterized membrane protein YoaK (UPF0700 family)